jgi:hypothetical protein
MAKLGAFLDHKQFPVALGALAVIVVGVLALSRSVSVVDPRVIVEQDRGLPARQPPFIPGLARFEAAMNGEVVMTADRIADAVALVFSASVYLGEERLKGRLPGDARTLLLGLSKKGLLPLGLTMSQSVGTLEYSAWGKVSVRYRPKPLGVEVVSIASKPDYGPALIIRAPDESLDGAAVRLFVAAHLEGVDIPRPFAPASEVIAMGWNPERLRALK